MGHLQRRGAMDRDHLFDGTLLWISTPSLSTSRPVFQEYEKTAAFRKKLDKINPAVVIKPFYILRRMEGGDRLGSVIKKRRKKMRKHKHRKLLAKTRHQRRKGK
jgi:hypothetical protein